MVLTIIFGMIFAFNQGYDTGRKTASPTGARGLPMYEGKPDVRAIDFEVDADKQSAFKSRRGEEVTR